MSNVIQQAKARKLMSEIIVDTLYLGGAVGAKNLDALNSLQITHIINLAGKAYFPHQFKYFKSHIGDSSDADLAAILFDIVAFIEQTRANKNNRIYVHCMAGISRSAAVVIGYIMLTNHCTYQEAFDFVKARRKCIRPNNNFVVQLREMEAKQLQP